MAAGLNRYKIELRELQFVLLEQFKFADWVGQAPFEAWGSEEAKAMLGETYRFAREVLGPLNAVGDRQGCRLENGQVRTPSGFGEAWKALYEAGFKQVAVSPEHGGQGAPRTLSVLIEEMLSGANTAFNMYPALTYGAADLVAECGTPEQVKKYAETMFNGGWGGTMCLTEPHAGSDVGAASTTARRNADGTYQVRGTKIYISGGDHDLAENVVHMVLARVEGAPPGTKGLSLFIIPKKRIGPDGSSGASNDVQVASIEHKMGINGSATCVLNFGESDGCVGELLGGVENQGMPQMFKMMNGA
ncbi:MAG TPA: acyl-CoA dehydrogenase family protein, partial [Myxococcaceae bacterium]|nr:acyl-CoA dehydrogenase family protein [Myxococcaceae bacterium]